jgi:hypothetical protein
MLKEYSIYNKRHIEISIIGFEKKLNSLNTFLRKNRYCENCFGLTLWEVERELEKFKSKWYTVVPNSNCNNIREDWSCWWH